MPAWQEPDLERRRKGYPEKLRIAGRLRQETTMTLGWIADTLRMGTKTYLSHLLYWQGKPPKPKQPAKTRN